MARFEKIANHPYPVGTIVYLLNTEPMKGWRAQIIGTDVHGPTREDGLIHRYALRLLDHPVPGHRKSERQAYLITRSWNEVSLRWPIKIEEI